MKESKQEPQSSGIPEEGNASPKKGSPLQTVLNVFGVVLCVIFIPVIILNVVMIVRSYTESDHIPSVFGYSPVIVLSGSMSPTFEAGDMIVIQKTDPQNLQVNDVICYLEEESAVTHRIIEIEQADGQVMYITQGDANNTEDTSPVSPSQIEGKYIGVHFAGLGDFAMFLQSPAGMAIFIGGPVVLFFLWDLFRRIIASRRNGKERKKREEADTAKQQEMEAMEQELQRLRAQVSGGTGQESGQAGPGEGENPPQP